MDAYGEATRALDSDTNIREIIAKAIKLYGRVRFFKNRLTSRQRETLEEEFMKPYNQRVLNYISLNKDKVTFSYLKELFNFFKLNNDPSWHETFPVIESYFTLNTRFKAAI